MLGIVMAILLIVPGLAHKLILRRPGIPRFVPRCLGSVFCYLYNVSVKTGGELKWINDRDHPACVYVLNHQSSLDASFVACAFPYRGTQLAKKEILYVPIFGIAFKLLGGVVIDRKNRESSIASLNEIAEQVEPWLFLQLARLT